jgi:hypothetical protein
MLCALMNFPSPYCNCSHVLYPELMIIVVVIKLTVNALSLATSAKPLTLLLC